MPQKRIKAPSPVRFAASFLSTPLRDAYRHVGQQWWVYDDGYWVQDRGSMRINAAICSYAESMGYEDGLKLYMIDRYRAVLAAQLHYDRLPARWDDSEVPAWALRQFPTPAGPASELQAHAASHSPVQPSSPGLPVADPGLEQADQGDTASPNGHIL
jgi:hypothetical protein